MIAHIGNNLNYYYFFINFIEENFDANQHKYLFFSSSPSPKHHSYQYYVDFTKNLSNETKERLIYVDSFKNYFKAIKILKQSEKIILHSFWPMHPVKFPLYYTGIKKSSWLIYGGDLYNYNLEKKKLINRIKWWPRNVLLKKVPEVITAIPKEYELAKNFFNMKALYKYAFTPNPVNFELLDDVKIKNHDGDMNNQIKLLIGNSASSTNNHIEIFKNLVKFKKENIKLIVPLNYGDMKYAEVIKKVGNELFGEKFCPLTKILSPETYSKLLSSIDICIMNHNRQQAMGNIIAILYLGKKLYLRSGFPHYEFLKQNNITIYDTKDIPNQSYEQLIHMESEKKVKNIKLIKIIYSQDVCIQSWKNIFNRL